MPEPFRIVRGDRRKETKGKNPVCVREAGFREDIVVPAAAVDLKSSGAKSSVGGQAQVASNCSVVGKGKKKTVVRWWLASARTRQQQRTGPNWIRGGRRNNKTTTTTTKTNLLKKKGRSGRFGGFSLSIDRTRSVVVAVVARPVHLPDWHRLVATVKVLGKSNGGVKVS